MMNNLKKVVAVTAIALTMASMFYDPVTTHRPEIVYAKAKPQSSAQLFLGLFGLPAGLGALKPAVAAGLVQSIQAYSVTIAATATSGTYTISSVDTSRSHIWPGGQTAQNTFASSTSSVGRAELTDATTVTAYRNTSHATNSITLIGFVVQWNSGVTASVQQGTITLTSSDTSATATISSITTTNSAVHFLGSTSDSSSIDHDKVKGRLDISSTTAVRFRRATSTDSLTGGFVAVQFASGILNSSTQQFAITGSATESTTTISGITLAQTCIFDGGISRGEANDSCDRLSYCWIKDTTTVATTQTSTTGADPIKQGTVVEFKSTDVVGVDRGTNTIAVDATTQDSTIGSVNTAKTVVSWLGYTASGSLSNPSREWTTVALQSATAVRNARNTASSSITITDSWEALEFV